MAEDNKSSSRRVVLFCWFLFGIIFGGGLCSLIWAGVFIWHPRREESRIKERLKKYTYEEAVVVADSKICSDVGRDILRENGNAVDAAIATMLCTGVVNCHSTGIGGGHFSIFYNSTSRDTIVVNAREAATLTAHKDMFPEPIDPPKRGITGGLAVAVPGDLIGFHELWRSAGTLPWYKLFEPSINLARNGFKINGALAFAINRFPENIFNDTKFKEIFTDGDGNLLQKGDIVYLNKLANTLEFIALNGSHASFYSGDLAKTIAKEIGDDVPEGETGGVTTRDLDIYAAKMEEPLQVRYGKLTMYSPQPPASGALVSFILNIIEGYYMTACSATSNEQCNRPLQYHRIVEAFKFSYAEREALADGVGKDVTDLLLSKEYADRVRRRITDDQTQSPEYYSEGRNVALYEEGGTAHVSVIDADGNAVGISGSINSYFGSLVLGNDTGIFYNNQMDDFAYNLPEPLPINFIAPQKRPLSSMVPTIIVDDDGNVRLVAGGAGSLSITTATALVIANTLWFQDDVFSASNRPRIHYPKKEFEVTYEPDVSRDIIEELILKGHNISEHNAKEKGPLSVIQLATRQETKLYAKSDSRKAGFGESGF